MTEDVPPPPPPAPDPDSGEPGRPSPSYPPPAFPPAGFPPPTYGQPTSQPPLYQPSSYDYSQYGYTAQPQGGDARSARLLVVLVVGIAVVLVIAGALIASLIFGRTTKLSHTAVEQFIATSYNADVVCNDGHDMPIGTDLTYSCAGDGVAFTVRMLDDNGKYQVETASPDTPTADASWRSPSESA